MLSDDRQLGVRADETVIQREKGGLERMGKLGPDEMMVSFFRPSYTRA